MLLTLPAVGLVVVALLLPLIYLLCTAVRDPELRATLPRTAAMLRAWDGQGLPDEAVFAALVEEAREAAEGQRIGGLAQRLNFERTGMRGLLLRAAESEVAAPYAMGLPALDRNWADPAVWHVLRRASVGVTPLYLLRAVDLDMTAEGDVAVMAERPFLPLLSRTLWIAGMVTLLCLVIGFPVAMSIAAMPPMWARVALGCVLVPFWISIIVRTTAWFVLLQREGPVNSVLMALGLVDHPLQIMFTRFAVYLAMVHVLLPFAVLPMLSVMRRIDRRFARAAASLGAPAWRRFVRVTLPLAWPGVRAGGLIVFMLASGFYITPALMGGGGDQMLGAFIAEYATASLNWGMAAALGLMLMAGVAAVTLAGLGLARLALGRAA